MSLPPQPVSMMPASETPPAPRVTVDVAAQTDRGLVRPRNEDSFVIYRLRRCLDRVESSIEAADLPEHYEDAAHLMVVADGMGGHSGGEVASRNALTAVVQMIIQSLVFFTSGANIPLF